MKLTYFKVVLSSLFLFRPLSVTALECRPGAYHVRPHLRTSYYRADGTFVNAAHVSESCREKNTVYNTWASRLKNGFQTPKAFDWMKKHFGDKFKIGKGSK